MDFVSISGRKEHVMFSSTKLVNGKNFNQLWINFKPPKSFCSKIESFVQISLDHPFIGLPSVGRPIIGQKDYYIKTKPYSLVSFLEQELDSAFELMSDDSDARFYSKDLDYLTDRKIQMRLTLWVKFFNDKYGQFLGAHSQMTSACILASKNCETFRTQTKHEFEVSIDFLNRLIAQKRFLTIPNIESGRFLLATALILGNYPGMVLRSIQRAVSKLNDGCSILSIKRLFSELFVKYEIPSYLIDSLPNLTKNELDALMFVIQGNSLRSFPSLPLPISKKETWVIQNRFPGNVRFDENILLKGIVCSKLLIGTQNGERIITDFVENCKPFQFNLQTFVDDISFWKQVFNMCNKIDWDEVVMSMGVFLDHIEYRRYVHNEDFSLKGRNPEALENELFEWNERQNYKELKKLRHLTWNGHGMDVWTFEHCGVEYQFGEIRSGKDLLKESKNLKHCAYGYIQYCADGHTSIWSLKRKEHSFYECYITVETRDSRVCQARGLRNRDLTRDEVAILEMVKEKFEFSNELDEMNADAL